MSDDTKIKFNNNPDIDKVFSEKTDLVLIEGLKLQKKQIVLSYVGVGLSAVLVTYIILRKK